jgi:chromosome segregation ATPase
LRTSTSLNGLLAMAALSLCGTAMAQVERSGGGANAQMAQQYQQVAAERNALQAANAKLKKDLDDQKSQLASALKQVAALKARDGGSAAQLAAAQTAKRNSDEEIEKTKAKLQELLARFRDTVAALSGVETERDQVKRDLTASIVRYDVCAQRNVEISQISNEVLDRLDHQTAIGVMFRAEPFTRIQRTRLDNLVDEYRQRVEELKVHRSGTPESPVVDAPAAQR